MSGAKELGRRLLDEVEVGSLAEILFSLRAYISPNPPPIFGVPELDDLIRPSQDQDHPQDDQHGNPQPRHPSQRPSEEAHTHDAHSDFVDLESTPPESTYSQVKSSPHQQPCDAHLTEPKPPVVELTSMAPDAGKTNLLYLSTCIGVLPRTFRGINIGGQEAAVVVFDTENRWDIKRLASVMVSHVLWKLHASPTADMPSQDSEQGRENGSRRQADQTTSSQPIDFTNLNPHLTAEIKTLIKSSLAHIHIYRPPSYTSLLSSIQSCSTYLSTYTSHPSFHRRIHAIMLDSASTYYWSIRAAQLNQMQMHHQQPSSSSTDELLSNPYTTLTAHLTALSLALRAQIICTSLCTSVSPFRSNLPPSWTHWADVKIDVERVTTGQKVIGSTLNEALAEEEKGKEREKETERENGESGRNESLFRASRLGKDGEEIGGESMDRWCTFTISRFGGIEIGKAQGDGDRIRAQG